MRTIPMRGGGDLPFIPRIGAEEDVPRQPPERRPGKKRGTLPGGIAMSPMGKENDKTANEVRKANSDLDEVGLARRGRLHRRTAQEWAVLGAVDEVLTAKQREDVEAVFWERLSIREQARRRGVSMQTVDESIRGAIRKLGKALDGGYVSEPDRRETFLESLDELRAEVESPPQGLWPPRKPRYLDEDHHDEVNGELIEPAFPHHLEDTSDAGAFAGINTFNRIGFDTGKWKGSKHMETWFRWYRKTRT